MKRIYWTCGFALLLAAGCSKPSKNVDGGVDAGVDGGVDAGRGLTCGQLVNCDNACGSAGNCTNNCYNDATSTAEGLFDLFNNCLNGACPSADGGPCADSNSDTCSTCDRNAATGSACSSYLDTCFQDAVVGPPADGNAQLDGGIYNCGQVMACQEACPADGGTACNTACQDDAIPGAIALEGALNSCLAVACPSTDGGPCAVNPSSDCTACINEVTLASPDTCAAQYIACNAPPGGFAPESFVDGGVLSTVLGGLDQCASTVIASGGYLYFSQVVSGSPIVRVPVTVGESGDAGTCALVSDDAGITTGVSGDCTAIGPNLPTPVSLAVDSNNVYAWSVGSFNTGQTTNNNDGNVVQIPINGDTPITLAQNMEVLYDAAYLNAVAIDSNNVYWVSGAIGSDGAINKIPIGGSADGGTAIFPGQEVPEAVTTDGTNVYWTEWGTYTNGQANNDGSVWWGSVNGGTAHLIASNQPAPGAIAVDGTNVYWANLGPLGGENLPANGSGSIVKAPIGSSTVTTIASAQAVPVAVIVSNGMVYWSQYGFDAPGSIMTTPAAGGPVVPLAAGLNDPAELAIWNNTLFWTDANSSPDNGFFMSLTPF